MATRAPFEPVVAHCLKDATTCDIEENSGEAEDENDVGMTSQKLYGRSPGAGLSQAGAGGPQDVLSEAKKLEEEILSHIPPPTPMQKSVVQRQLEASELRVAYLFRRLEELEAVQATTTTTSPIPESEPGDL